MPVIADSGALRRAVENEDRLRVLRETGLLDEEEAPAFQRLVRLASDLIGAPVALVSLVDRDRQYFAAQVGLAEPWASCRETPLSHSFCQHAVATNEPLIIEDAREHPVLKESLAVPDLGVVAYAGIPLLSPHGQALGSLCVIDGQPREWSDEEVQILEDLAGAAMTEIELRLSNRALEEQRARLQRILDGITDVFIHLDRDWTVTHMNPAAAEITGMGQEELLGRNLWDAFPEAVGTVFEHRYRRAMKTGEVQVFEAPYEPLDIVVAVRAFPTEDGLTILAHNRTEEVRLEEELNRFAAGMRRLGEVVSLCAWCREVKVEEGDWRTVERVVQDLAGVSVTHGLCPDCERDLDPEGGQG